ncbi:MAG TPA: sensor histidine kinase [Steroidobacteraceae bacterium]|nr:sensor histidine kinase [Steroidobacteraceae bacterium]
MKAFALCLIIPKEGDMETRGKRPECEIGSNNDLPDRVSFATHLQEMLVREAYHRVKNSLQLLGSLLRLQSKRAASDEVTIQLESASQRVMAVASVYDMLTQEVSDKIPMPDCLARLCDSFSGEKHKGISLELAADEICLDADRALPLCLFASEAIANSLRHAFVGRQSGLIKVEMCKCGDGLLRLEIEDDGIGRTQSEPEGLGSNLLRTLSMQVHGHLVQKSDPGKGCAVSVYVRE